MAMAKTVANFQSSAALVDSESVQPTSDNSDDKPVSWRAALFLHSTELKAKSAAEEATARGKHHQHKEEHDADEINEHSHSEQIDDQRDCEDVAKHAQGTLPHTVPKKKTLFGLRQVRKVQRGSSQCTSS
jgi:hypothetical protein